MGDISLPLTAQLVKDKPVSSGFIYGYYEKAESGRVWNVYDQDHECKIGMVRTETEGRYIVLSRYDYARERLKFLNECLMELCEREGGKKLKHQGFIIDREWECARYTGQFLTDAESREMIASYEGDSIGAAAAFICRVYDDLGSSPYGKWYLLRSEEEKVVEA